MNNPIKNAFNKVKQEKDICDKRLKQERLK